MYCRFHCALQVRPRTRLHERRWLCVRVLFTAQPFVGHVASAIPLAQALVTVGHDVRFACSCSFRPCAEKWGFRCFDAGLDWLGSDTSTWPFPPPTQDHAVTWSPEAFRQWLVALFADVAVGPMARDVVAKSREWSPDLIVTESLEFGGCIAAETLGVPNVVLANTARSGVDSPSIPFFPGNRRLLAQALTRQRAAAHLPPDPEVMMPFRYAALRYLPRSWDPPELPATPNTVFCRYVPPRHAELAAGPRQPPRRPAVAVSLGTLVQRTPGVLAAIVAALGTEDLEAVVTLGGRDPDEIGVSPPANVRVVSWVAQPALVSQCDLLVTHGGCNSVTEALSAGVPMVVVPVLGGAYSAQRCCDLGLGQSLAPTECRPSALRHVVRHVLGDPSYRNRARAMQAEMAALPGPTEVVAMLEQVSAAHDHR